MDIRQAVYFIVIEYMSQFYPAFLCLGPPAAEDDGRGREGGRIALDTSLPPPATATGAPEPDPEPDPRALLVALLSLLAIDAASPSLFSEMTLPCEAQLASASAAVSGGKW